MSWFGKYLPLWKFFKVLGIAKFGIGKISILLWPFFVLFYGQIFNGQYWTDYLTIWSHCLFTNIKSLFNGVNEHIILRQLFIAIAAALALAAEGRPFDEPHHRLVRQVQQDSPRQRPSQQGPQQVKKNKF